MSNNQQPVWSSGKQVAGLSWQPKRVPPEGQEELRCVRHVFAVPLRQQRGCPAAVPLCIGGRDMESGRTEDRKHAAQFQLAAGVCLAASAQGRRELVPACKMQNSYLRFEQTC